ncbi:hypothetical protein BDQ17DRAFT_1354176 [Cyathus striatus]|nr:hypothetical protein BDQ17DRAFT_1354176 [Cyathus striatus]
MDSATETESTAVTQAPSKHTDKTFQKAKDSFDALVLASQFKSAVLVDYTQAHLRQHFLTYLFSSCNIASEIRTNQATMFRLNISTCTDS